MNKLTRRIALFLILIISGTICVWAEPASANTYAALVSMFSGDLEYTTASGKHVAISAASEIPPGATIDVKKGSANASIELVTPGGFNSYSDFPISLGQKVFTPAAGERMKKNIAGIAIRAGGSKGLDPMFEWNINTFNISETDLASGYSLVLSPSGDSLSRKSVLPLTFSLAKDLKVKSVAVIISPNPADGSASFKLNAGLAAGEWLLDFKAMGLRVGYRYNIKISLTTESGKVMESILTVGVITDAYVKSLIETALDEAKGESDFDQKINLASYYKDAFLMSAYYETLAAVGYDLERMR